MKAILTLALALATVAPSPAEIFRPGAGRGGPGGGHPDHGPARVVHRGYDHGGYIYRHHPSVYVGFGPSYYYPAYGYYPGYGVDYPYYGTTGYSGGSSGASTGFWLGALAGGIIGNNSSAFGHNGLRGAAWGAGAGLLLGAVADANRREVVYRNAPAAAPATAGPVTTSAAATPAAPQQVTIINNYYNSSSPMSGANNLFGR